MKYVIVEKQNLPSQREGVTIEAKSLRGAKCAAMRRQCFHDTCLAIYDTANNLLAYREPTDDGWVDVLRWE